MWIRCNLFWLFEVWFWKDVRSKRKVTNSLHILVCLRSSVYGRMGIPPIYLYALQLHQLIHGDIINWSMAGVGHLLVRSIVLIAGVYGDVM